MNDKPPTLLTNPIGAAEAVTMLREWDSLDDHRVADLIERLTRERDEAYNKGFACGSGDEGAYQREIARLRAALERIAYGRTGHYAVDAQHVARGALSGEPPSPAEPEAESSVTRLPVAGSKLARISDLADDLIRELERQGLEKLQAVFKGKLLRIEPYTEPEKSTAQPWKCDWPGCTRREIHGHAGMPPEVL